MTEPTQAQIEAADLIDRLARLAKEPHLKHLPLAEAAAALTAAAEVEQPAIKQHDAYWRGVDEAVAATIERCAQVLDGYIGRGPKLSMLAEIAAAIRALKDKP